jgi:type I restriction enzyme M protein
MSFLERAIADGHAKLFGDGKQQKITCVAVNHTERYADPEEQVRAEFNLIPAVTSNANAPARRR